MYEQLNYSNKSKYGLNQDLKRRGRTHSIPLTQPSLPQPFSNQFAPVACVKRIDVMSLTIIEEGTVKAAHGSFIIFTNSGQNQFYSGKNSVQSKKTLSYKHILYYVVL